MQAIRLREDRRQQPQPIEEEDFELMTANLLEIKRQITERDQMEFMQSSDGFQSGNRSVLETYKMNYNNLASEIRSEYQRYLAIKHFPKNHQQKLALLLEESISVGSAVALYEMVFYFREAIDGEILRQISQLAFQGVLQFDHTTGQRCFSQLIAQCGIYDETICNYYAQGILQESIDFDICFLVLSNMGYMGLADLVNLADQEIKQLTNKILDNLSRTQLVIRQVIVPALIFDVHEGSTKNPKQKDISLAALNRLNGMNSSQDTLQSLHELIGDGSIDQRILIATIRSSGLDGEKFLLGLLKNKKLNESLALLIISVLSWRIRPKPILRIKSIQYNLESCFLPGNLYQYEGSIEPSGYINQQDCYDSLCLNSRDFLATLQRLITARSQEGLSNQEIRKQGTNNKHLFLLQEIVAQDQQQRITISEEVVKALINQLSNKSPKVRQTALSELGNIGLPEAYESIERVSKCLWDSDSNIRSAACWVLSKLCQQPNKKCINRLVELLKDNFWKVRTSACITIGTIIRQPLHNVVEGLLKALNDGSISKATVCEAIIRLGLFGEQILIQFLKNSPKNDFKIRQAIIASFEFVNVNSVLINSVIQETFKNCREARIQTRELCLSTLNTLRQRISREGSENTYLKAKNILPFYYYFLEDPVPKIRQIASQSIMSFGSQAELIFIEGLTRGQPLAKIQCVKCLSRLGVQNFRALILGLRDEDERVKRAAVDAILSNFTSTQIIDYFSGRQNHSISLLCNLKDILQGVKLGKEIKKFIKEIIFKVEKIEKNISPKSLRQNDENFMIN